MSFMSTAPWFAFIVHPRNLPELIAMPGASLVYDHSESNEEFIAKALGNPPVVLADVVFSGSAVRGELIGIGFLPDAMLSTDANRAVAEAVGLAADRGAPVIGLGALTAPATAGGRALLGRLPRGVTLTNGNGLTAATVRDNVAEAIAHLGIGRAARVALLGATGSVGAALARLLADEDLELILLGSSVGRLERTLGDLLAAGHRADSDLGSLGEADVVVILTNAATAKVTPDLVKPGAIVIDVAQPANVDAADLPGFLAREVSVVAGGVVSIPNYSCRQTSASPGRPRPSPAWPRPTCSPGRACASTRPGRRAPSTRSRSSGRRGATGWRSCRWPSMRSRPRRPAERRPDERRVRIRDRRRARTAAQRHLAQRGRAGPRDRPAGDRLARADERRDRHGDAARLGSASPVIGALQCRLLSDLARRYPARAGGAPVYAHAVLGRRVPLLGALSSWGYWFAWTPGMRST